MGDWRLNWNGREVLAAAEAAVTIAGKKGAEMVEADMKRFCPVLKDEDYENYGIDSFGFGGYVAKKRPGELRDAIKTMKSKHGKNDLIVGVFDYSKGSKWEDTLGARAVFVEYGHAGPGDARGPKVTTPQPFIRKARDRNKRKIPKIFAEEIKRQLRLNESSF